MLDGDRAEIVVRTALVERAGLRTLREVQASSGDAVAFGRVKRGEQLFVADDDVRYLDGLNTVVPDGETVSIIPAVAGGC